MNNEWEQKQKQNNIHTTYNLEWYVFCCCCCMVYSVLVGGLVIYEQQAPGNKNLQLTNLETATLICQHSHFILSLEYKRTTNDLAFRPFSSETRTLCLYVLFNFDKHKMHITYVFCGHAILFITSHSSVLHEHFLIDLDFMLDKSSFARPVNYTVQVIFITFVLF